MIALDFAVYFTGKLSSNLLMVHDLQIELNKTLVLVLISILCLCSAIILYNLNKLCKIHSFLYPTDSWEIQTALQYFNPTSGKIGLICLCVSIN